MCVCVFIELHVTAQSGPAILVILCHSRWSSQGGITATYDENLSSDVTKGIHSLYSSHLSPGCLAPPPLLPLYFLHLPGQYLLNQHSLFSTFSCPSARVSPRVPHRVLTLVGLFALLRLSSALLDPVSRLPSRGSGSPHDATVLLGRSVFLRLGLLVTR